MKPSAKSLSLHLLYQPGAKMVTASKATVPTISDQASAMQLSQCAKNLASALAELRTASQKVLHICSHCVDDVDSNQTSLTCFQ